jgi:hypothetical protein
VLRQIRDALNQNPALLQRVGLQIKEIGQNERRRYAQLLQYRGPDHATLTILEHNAEYWLIHPEQFWKRPAAPNIGHLPPQAQIIGCFLQTEADDA